MLVSVGTLGYLANIVMVRFVLFQVVVGQNWFRVDWMNRGVRSNRTMAWMVRFRMVRYWMVRYWMVRFKMVPTKSIVGQ